MGVPGFEGMAGFCVGWMIVRYLQGCASSGSELMRKILHSCPGRFPRLVFRANEGFPGESMVLSGELHNSSGSFIYSVYHHEFIGLFRILFCTFFYDSTVLCSPFEIGSLKGHFLEEQRLNPAIFRAFFTGCTFPLYSDKLRI